MTESDRRCSVSDCPVGTSGVCLNGFDDLERCPYYDADFNPELDSDSSEETEESAEQGAAVSSVTEHEWRSLYSGAQIDSGEAGSIMRRRRCRIIALAGQQESGKTTLLTSIYESFHQGRFAGYQFIGSRTLWAFEQRCHLSRIESEQDQPQTERTKLAESGFLHLRLHGQARDFTGDLDLLFWDFTGEVFERAADDQIAAERLRVIRAADRLVLLIDGERLAARRTRTSTRTHARSLLRSLLEAKSLPRHAFVDVVLTKWDAVVDGLGADGARDTFCWVRDSLVAEFGTRVAKLEVDFVAARPMVGDLPYAYRVANLFAQWISDVPERRFIEPESRELPVGARAFDLFGH